MSATSETLFTRIINRQITAEIIYEDDLAIAIKDINPQAPIHLLIIPKKPLPSLADAAPENHRILGHLLMIVKRVAEQVGLSNGYRVVINTGNDGGQTVNHLHLHLLGGRPLHWPPG